VLKDVSSGLAPLSRPEAASMVRNLRSYKLLKGYRHQQGINISLFEEIIVRLSSLLRFAVEIKELDINPLMGDEQGIVVVDARMRVER
jgi:acetyltransferase